MAATLLSSLFNIVFVNFVLLGLDGNTAVAAYGVIANTALVGTAIFNGAFPAAEVFTLLLTVFMGRRSAAEKKKFRRKTA